jgi:NitT/TauT family transport system substrate-binding protein
VRAAAAALALLAAGGCRRSAAPEVVTIGTARQPAFGLVFIAEAKGYFAEEGLRVEQRRFATGRDALDALVSAQVDAATAFDTPVVLRAAKVPELEILTTLHVASRYTRVVARRDRGIGSEADLRGKRLAAPAATSAEYLLHHLLRLGGVAPREVTVADLEPDAAVDALASGEVDAIATWTPHAERAVEKLGAAATVEIGSDAYTETSMLVTRSGVRAARAGALVKLVRALARAERLAQTSPEEAREALAAEFPELSADELRRRWERQTLQLGLSELLAHVLTSEAGWFRETGRLGAPALDVERLLVPDVLARVDDQAVTFAPAAAAER